jgi:hypothetical protein
VERAALIELIKDEMSYADSGYSIAALDVDDEDE